MARFGKNARLAAVVVAAAIALVPAAANAHGAFGGGGWHSHGGTTQSEQAVSGSVVDTTGTPIAGITVDVYNNAKRGFGWGFGHGSKHLVASTTTTAGGTVAPAATTAPMKARHPASVGWGPVKGIGNPYNPYNPYSPSTGNYSLQLPQGAYRFVFSGSGYVTATEFVRVSGTTTVPTVTLLKAPPTATTAPAIAPTTATVGTTLTATPGTWSTTGLSFSYQWLRDGFPIRNATSSTYTVAPADSGSKLRVRVTATGIGLAPGHAVSNSVKIAALTSTTTATATTVGRRFQVPALAVTVTAPGQSDPTGVVKVWDGTRLVGVAWLSRWDHGTVTVPLRRLPAGTDTVTAEYLGNEQVNGSTSSPVTITVPTDH